MSKGDTAFVRSRASGRESSTRFLLRGSRALLAVLVLTAGLVGADVAMADDVCESCQGKLVGRVYSFKDNYHHKSRLVCKECTQLATRCIVCGMPAHPQFGLLLADGKAYCAEDAKEAVITQEVAAALFAEASQEAMDLLKGYPPLPQRNIEIHLVEREEFNRQYRRTPGIDDPSKLLGLTRSERDEQGKFTHDIYLLHGVPRDEFRAICAHEYAHTWLNERHKKTRQVYQDTAEGFCELIAYKVVSKSDLEEEKKRITQSTYTRGQVNVLLAADREYEFHRVVRWITDGVDSWLDTEKLPRLLVLRETDPEPPAYPNWPPSKRSAVPNQLVLKGLSGPSNHRYALINNATLAVGEESRVRVGASNQLVRCLSVGSNAVLIQVRGEPSPRELRFEGR